MASLCPGHLHGPPPQQQLDTTHTRRRRQVPLSVTLSKQRKVAPLQVCTGAHACDQTAEGQQLQA